MIKVGERKGGGERERETGKTISVATSSFLRSRQTSRRRSGRELRACESFPRDAERPRDRVTRNLRSSFAARSRRRCRRRRRRRRRQRSVVVRRRRVCAPRPRERSSLPLLLLLPPPLPSRVRNSKESRKLEREFFGADYCDVAETPIPPIPRPRYLGCMCGTHAHARASSTRDM